MNALLVYPAYPDTFWSFKRILSFVFKKAAFPPLGLLTVAAMLLVEWEKRLADTNVTPLGNTDLEWADVVLVSPMMVQLPSAKKIMKRAKEADKIVIAGESGDCPPVSNGRALTLRVAQMDRAGQPRSDSKMPP